MEISNYLHGVNMYVSFSPSCYSTYVLFAISILQEELSIAILEAYVRHLIEDKQMSLVATYTATLPQHLQLEWYARFLEGMDQTRKSKTNYFLAFDLDIE